MEANFFIKRKTTEGRKFFKRKFEFSQELTSLSATKSNFSREQTFAGLAKNRENAKVSCAKVSSFKVICYLVCIFMLHIVDLAVKPKLLIHKNINPCKAFETSESQKLVLIKK